MDIFVGKCTMQSFQQLLINTPRV